jgi:hypothetical protein
VLKLIEGSGGMTYGDGATTLTYVDGSFNVKFTTGRAPLEGCVPRR